MTLDGSYDAVLDRIEAGTAVVLVEHPASGEVIDELHSPASELPDDVKAGCVLRVTVDEGSLVGIEPRPETTEDRRERAQSRFDRLSERPSNEAPDRENE